MSNAPEWVRIYADSALDAMWTYYRRFEALDATRRTFGEWLTADNATAARDCVRQAREYFFSARAAPLLTRPVLLYYGMVSLSKLLFLFNESPTFTMDDIETFERQGHGLKQFDPAADLGPYRIEAGLLEVTADKGKAGTPLQPRGVYPRLAELIVGAPVAAWYGQRFTIMEVLRAVPQLDTVLREVFGSSFGYSGVGALTLDPRDGSLEVHIDKSSAGITDAEAAYMRLSHLDPAQFPFVPPLTGTVLPEMEVLALRFRVGTDGYRILVREEFFRDALTIPPALKGVRFDSLLATYMLMYALSIVARYKPHRWAHILDGRDSPLLPVIETQMMVAERWWPNLLLNRITGKWICFGQPAYYS